MTRDPMNEERVNDLLSHDDAPNGLDPLDAMFREAYGAPQTINDDGFTDQVMAQLPQRRHRPAIRRVILSVAGVLSLFTAALLPNGLSPRALIGSGASSPGQSQIDALARLPEIAGQLQSHNVLLYSAAALAVIGFAMVSRWDSSTSRL